jgi:MtaA/CmuA family methyltransferase
MTGKERVIARIAGRETDSLPLMPITMMFAGDLIGRKYGDYARDHRVMAEAQLKTAETFDFDYVSAISDPAREASDLGATVEWFDNQPPAIIESKALLTDKAKLKDLRIPDASTAPRMSDRLEALRILSERAGGEKIIEGWVEGPCAESADLRGLNTLMLDFADDEAFVMDLTEFVTAMAIDFARHQVQAGATLIGIGDAAASLIGPRVYEKFILPNEKRLIAAIHGMGVMARLHICGNTKRILKGMGETGADIVDLDYPAPVGDGRAAMKPEQVLLGNIDPVRVLRDGTPESVQAAVGACYEQAGKAYIVGAGCEVTRGTPIENVHALTRFARGRN